MNTSVSTFFGELMDQISGFMFYLLQHVTHLVKYAGLGWDHLMTDSSSQDERGVSSPLNHKIYKEI